MLCLWSNPSVTPVTYSFHIFLIGQGFSQLYFAQGIGFFPGGTLDKLFKYFLQALASLSVPLFLLLNFLLPDHLHITVYSSKENWRISFSCTQYCTLTISSQAPCIIKDKTLFDCYPRYSVLLIPKLPVWINAAAAWRTPHQSGTWGCSALPTCIVIWFQTGRTPAADHTRTQGLNTEHPGVALILQSLKPVVAVTMPTSDSMSLAISFENLHTHAFTNPVHFGSQVKLFREDKVTSDAIIFKSE